MNPLARARHVLARRPWLYWTTVLVVAAVGGWAVAVGAAGIDHARRAWGSPRDVVIASEDIAPGDLLAAHTEVRARPSPAVPAAAITSLPPGATARQHITTGEALVAVDMAPASGPQALIPVGWAAVAVAEVVPTGAVVGDHVAAVTGGIVLAAEALVVGLVADALLVAVPAAEAPQVAHAATSGELALVLVP